MKLKESKGFTLVEVLLTLGLLGIIMTVVGTMFMFSTRAHSKSVTEYEIQANMRLAVEKLNNDIRDSTSTFALYRENSTNLTPGWNYIMVSADGRSVIEYKWDRDKNKHIEILIVEPQDGITYNLTFKKDSYPYIDNLINYTLEKKMDGGNPWEISSEVAALNALQVIDRSKDLDKQNGNMISNTLAYRIDSRPDELSESKAAVALVLDTSGSMGETLQNGKSRLYFLKQEASNLIEGLSKNPNVHLSLNPFARTANRSEEMKLVSTNKGSKTENPSLLYTIDKLVDFGGTNTGDGMRRAYYRIIDFNENSEFKDRDIKNFMVILVDGDTTFASVTEASSSVSGTKYFEVDDDVRELKVGVGSRDNKGEGYYGNGSTYDKYGKKYVEIIGDKIKTYEMDSTRKIKVYIIGYSNEPSPLGLNDLSSSTTDGPNNWVQAGSSEALKEIFDAIQFDINESLWHIGGPQ